MNTMTGNKIQSVAVSIAMMAMLAVLAGCESDKQAVEQTVQSEHPEDNQVSVDQPAGEQQPLEHVMESDGFTLRANISRTDVLPEAMARRYDIDPDADLILLNLVILENRQGQQSAPVSAEVSAYYESLSGHVETIDMRAVEANGHVSYIGTLDAGTQRSLQLHIEAQPAGADQPLHMTFEVELEAFEFGDSE